MKKPGVQSKPLTSEQLAIVREYLTGPLSLREIAERYGVTRGSITYWVVKYRKENQKETITT